MIEQLMRSIEMVLLKQLNLITGEGAKPSGWQFSNPGVDSKMEMFIGINNQHYMDKQFKITIEEIV